jgi:hypothetical protein
MHTYYLYRIHFPNGKTYTGITNNVKRRQTDHQRQAQNPVLPVHNAIAKYGWASVNFKVLLRGPRDLIARLEIAFIADRPGYNLSPGGDISPMTLPAVRAKVAASMARRFEDTAVREANRTAQRAAQNRPEVASKKAEAMRGKTHTVETKARMSTAGAGKKQSADHVAKRTQPQIGAKRSAESRVRMSEGQKKRQRTPEELERMKTLSKNRVVTPESKEKMRLAAIARWARR